MVIRNAISERPHRIVEDDGLQVDSEEVAPETNYHKQHYRSASDVNSLERNVHYMQREKPLPVAPKQLGKRTIYGIRRRWFWLATIGTIIIVATLAGGLVGGLVGAHGKSTTVATLTAPAPAAASASSTATVASIRDDSELAAVAFNDTNDILQYRVYYQDTSDNVRESSWNASSRTWYVSNESVAKAKPRSPIAAAATGLPEFPSPQINLYTLDSSNIVNEWTIDPSSSVTWSSGMINSANIQAANNSNLVAVSHSHPGCFGCSNETVLVYEDANNKLNAGRGNLSGWTWDTLSAAPVSGSGIGLCLRWYSDDTTTGMRLFYQGASQIEWYEWDVKSSNDTDPNFTNWKYSDTFADSSFLNGSIAAFAYGTNMTTGLPLNLEILSSSSHGVINYPWVGYAPNGLFKDTQTPSVMESLDAYTPIAANLDGRVYGMQGGVIKEFILSPDGSSTWTLAGNVTTG